MKLQQKMREAQMMAEDQGRVPKGTFNKDSENKNSNTNSNRLRKKK